MSGASVTQLTEREMENEAGEEGESAEGGRKGDDVRSVQVAQKKTRTLDGENFNDGHAGTGRQTSLENSNHSLNKRRERREGKG